MMINTTRVVQHLRLDERCEAFAFYSSPEPSTYTMI